MSGSQPKEPWGTTPRFAVAERLRTRWKQTKATEPDDDAIGEALDQTQPADQDEERWFAAARTRLDL